MHMWANARVSRAVVAPIIERRRVLKSSRKHKGDAHDLRQNALKWLLVTCFGYTGYRNARFGRIEAHEAICAWSRDLLLTTIEAAQQEVGCASCHRRLCLAFDTRAFSRTTAFAAEDFAKRISSWLAFPPSLRRITILLLSSKPDARFRFSNQILGLHGQGVQG